MLSFGQLASDRIIVRRAHQGESIITLDGQCRTLTTENLVIADTQKAVALAGVMGGQNSEISPSTTRIVLEAATFNHANIRATRVSTGLQSEATNRFEKGLSPQLTSLAIAKAWRMIKELIPGARLTAVADADSRH